METRILTEKDRKQCAALWQLCFSDSDEFVTWFFERRYCPAYSACIEENGVIMCALHGYPFSIRIRDFTVPGAIIAGVATHPDHRGKGLMKKLMAFEMENLRTLGCAVVTHTPAEIPVYHSCGHFPCSDSLYFDLASMPSVFCTSDKPIFCSNISEELLQNLLDCYQQFSVRYSAIISRTLENMRLKAEDYFADHMRCAYIRTGEAVQAYAFFKEQEDNTVYIEELIYRQEEDALELMAGVQSAFPGKILQGKLPPDFSRTAYFREFQVRPQTVMGLVNPDILPPHIRASLPRVILQDPLVPQNNTEIPGSGGSEDVISLQAGTFMQLLSGYKTASALLPEKNSAVLQLETALPKQPCYIIDAY